MKKQLNEITSAQKHVEGWLLTNEEGDLIAVVKSGDNLAGRNPSLDILMIADNL